MTETELDAAARRAFDAECAVRRAKPTDAGFAESADKWRGIVRAALGDSTGQQLHDSVSAYARNVFALHGMEGLWGEIVRLLHKLETAAGHYHPGPTLDLMSGTAAYRARAEVQRDRADATSLALELDGLQSRVVQAQQQMDPHTKAALIMHVDADKWDRYDSYQAYIDSLNPERHAA